MSGETPVKPAAVEFRSIVDWLGRGWYWFRRNSIASMAYILVFVVIGMVAEFWLRAAGYWLVYFILAGGFILLLPVLLSAYYRVPEIDGAGGQPKLRDITGALFASPAPVWILGVVSGALYLIWVTDALIVYSVYFEFEPVRDLLSDPLLREDGIGFMTIAGLLGFVISTIVYVITVVAVPHMISAGAGLVDGIVFSARSVGGNLRVMISWAVLLGSTILLVFLFALPLAVVLLPLLSYANYACYREILGEDRD